MRLRRPLGATYTGLVVMGLLGSGSFGLLSAVMFLDRPLGEPLINLVLSLAGAMMRGRSGMEYDPDYYYFWAAVAGLMALLWAVLSIRSIMEKPHEDHRLDAAIKSKLVPSVRGAPLEPEQ